MMADTIWTQLTQQVVGHGEDAIHFTFKGCVIREIVIWKVRPPMFSKTLGSLVRTASSISSAVVVLCDRPLIGAMVAACNGTGLEIVCV